MWLAHVPFLETTMIVVQPTRRGVARVTGTFPKTVNVEDVMPAAASGRGTAKTLSEPGSIESRPRLPSLAMKSAGFA